MAGKKDGSGVAKLRSGGPLIANISYTHINYNNNNKVDVTLRAIKLHNHR